MIYFILMFLIVILFKNNLDKQVYVKSQIDNRFYLVNNSFHKQEISNTLSLIRNKIIYLVNNTIVNSKNKMYIDNILNRIYDTKFIQNQNKFPKKNATSYSVNKGDKIVLCLYDYTNKVMYDFNTLMYVSIHELSHIANPTIGHDESFYYIFNDLINNAIRLKIYNFYDYEKIPVKYCGIYIESN